MKYFKFFIKETSGEYYNLAMDRYYDAEDGQIWLSFPSSDRNKLDIDTFLILKKGVESNEMVSAEAKYKVLDIQSEAPDFIKFDKQLIEQRTHLFDSSDIFGGGLVACFSLYFCTILGVTFTLGSAFTFLTPSLSQRFI